MTLTGVKSISVPVVIGLALILLLMLGYFSVRVFAPPIRDDSPIPNPTFSPIDMSRSDYQKIISDLVEAGVPCGEINPPSNPLGSCTLDKVVYTYAKGTSPQGYWIASLTEGKWKVSIGGNGIPSCVEVDSYKIPKSIYGDCIEVSGQLRSQTK